MDEGEAATTRGALSYTAETPPRRFPLGLNLFMVDDGDNRIATRTSRAALGETCDLFISHWCEKNIKNKKKMGRFSNLFEYFKIFD